MDEIKHSRRFAEIETLMGSYFRHHLVPVMTQTQTYLTEKQGEEMKEYSTSISGILGMMASAGQPLSDPYQTLKVTGEWNSKTTEDYIEMCNKRILSSEEIQHDLAYMAGEWRDTVVQEVGRERYDELSQELGCDLAYAFVDYRVEQLMIDHLVKERMPKSSADYIIRKAAESSLLGLPQALSRSPLAEEIEKRGEAAYRPSKLEKEQVGCWGLQPIPSCWAVQVRGRASHGSSERIQPSRPLPITSGQKRHRRSLQRSVSARVCSAAKAMCSRDSVRKQRRFHPKRTHSWPKPTESYRKRYRL